MCVFCEACRRASAPSVAGMALHVTRLILHGIVKACVCERENTKLQRLSVSE